MADYVPPGVVEKRVRYFDGQFLQDQDFIDEQNYQLDREHRHNRLLHGPGIADGLTVTSTAPNQVTVAPGTAIDSDGHQLALADATTVDLPAGDFNDKQGVQLYLSYAESAEDPQAVGGSQDFTRWLERPELTAVAPGHDYAGASPPVLLASLALDNGGRVAVDGTVRSYAGVRLPGAAADAVTLRATSGGPVDLAGSLTIENRVGIGAPSPAFPLHLGVGKALRIEGGSSSSDSASYFSFGGNGAFGIDAPGVVGGRFTVQNTGHVGIGTASPGNDLEVGAFQAQDRFLAFKVQGGNAYRSGIKLFTWKDNNGFSVQYDERNQTGNGLHVKTHNQDADGTTQLFVGWSGNIGVGTTTPAARFSVVAPGTTEIAGSAHSAVLRTTAGALGQTAGSEVALSSTGFSAAGNKVALGVRAIRTAAGTDWYSTAIGLGMDVDNTVRAGSSLFLHANHNVGIGTSTPGNDLEIGAFDNQDRFLAFKVQGGNAHRSGIKMWTFKDNYGYSIQYDERLQTGNGLHIKTHNQNADGVTQLFVGWDGNIGIGTTNPAGQKLNVVGSTYLQGDLFVGGRMIYTSGGNSWWQLYPRQSGLDPTWWTANNGVGGPSDIRLKTDLRPISHALDLVRKLQGVRYQWGDEGLARFTRDIEDTVLAGPDATDEQNHERQQAERRRILQSLSGDRMGMVAQDVEAIAPELVYADEDGYKHIRYQHVTALLAEAIKEQDAVVQALSAEVAALRAKH